MFCTELFRLHAEKDEASAPTVNARNNSQKSKPQAPITMIIKNFLPAQSPHASRRVPSSSKAIPPPPSSQPSSPPVSLRNLFSSPKASLPQPPSASSKSPRRSPNSSPVKRGCNPFTDQFSPPSRGDGLLPFPVPPLRPVPFLYAPSSAPPPPRSFPSAPHYGPPPPPLFLSAPYYGPPMSLPDYVRFQQLQLSLLEFTVRLSSPPPFTSMPCSYPAPGPFPPLRACV